MSAYIKKIDIKNEGKVVVEGYLTSSKLIAKLSEKVYIEEPDDGIMGYTLETFPKGDYGANVMVDFKVDAPWTGNQESNGLRISQPNASPEHPNYETILYKLKEVESYTEENSNHVDLLGGSFEEESNQLIVDVKYSGGCFPHNFSLEWDGKSLESNPPQYIFKLIDLSENDPCRGYFSAQLRFDIDTPNIQLDRPSIVYINSVIDRKQIKIDIY